MQNKLSVSLGQFSDAGLKPTNQDFHGAYVPKEPALSNKGIAIAIADGISTSNVSQIASEMAISSFLNDYYCTSDTWSVKKSVQTILSATNSWLYSQSRNGPNRFNKDKGFVCTFSGLVLKAHTAHIFHCGDSRIYQLTQNSFECLTQDHRHNISEDTSYLTNALGIHNTLNLDYSNRAVQQGDCFLVCTDGIHEFLSDQELGDFAKQAQRISASKISELNAADLESDDLEHTSLDSLAKTIAEQALANGSKDNISLQLLSVNQLHELAANEVSESAKQLALPPAISPRMEFDGFKIIRPIYISSRSHVYLAEDLSTGENVAMKVPSEELKQDKDYLENLLMEDWIAKRIDNLHVLKGIHLNRKRNYLYILTEFIEGQTLHQWMIDNPKPTLEQVRNIVEQIAKGIQAFHRQEMIHQDLRPQNIMLDATGTVKIIDFGSTKVAGITEIQNSINGEATNDGIVGTLQYSAPEYFSGDAITNKADIFSLGVIAYQMLSGKLPYGIKVSNAKTKLTQRKLRYTPLVEHGIKIPEWLDDTLSKAVNSDPLKRYYEVSEFIYDLRNPKQSFMSKAKPPLIDRNPLLFWQGLSLVLSIIIVVQIILFQ